MSHLIKVLAKTGTFWINPSTVALIGERNQNGTPVWLTDGTALLLVEEEPEQLAIRIDDAARERSG